MALTTGQSWGLLTTSALFGGALGAGLSYYFSETLLEEQKKKPWLLPVAGGLFGMMAGGVFAGKRVFK